jgi:CHASE1-domain containing sensor protein
MAAAWYVVSMGEARLRADFLADAEALRHEVELRLNSHFDTVRAVSALLTANNEVNGAEFKAFVAALRLRDQYPGLDGIGFALHVRRGSLPAVLRSLALDGTRIEVWPPGPRDEYTLVAFLEPGSGQNATAIGFDLTTDPPLRAAVERARDQGQPVVVPTEFRALAGTDRSSHLFILPIYERNAPTGTIEQRRRAFVGLVFGQFGADELLGFVASSEPSVALEVYSGETPAAASLLYRSAPEPASRAYRSAGMVAIAGQPWLAIVAASPRMTTVVYAVAGTLGAGALLAFALLDDGAVRGRAAAGGAAGSADAPAEPRPARRSPGGHHRRGGTPRPALRPPAVGCRRLQAGQRLLRSRDRG